jgi:hypothetical protein
MEKKNNSLRRAVSSSVLFGFLAILLYAPNVRADLVIPAGQTMDVDYDVGDFLEIFGTANLYHDASASFGIFAYPGQGENDPGSVVNIYGCDQGNQLNVLEAGTTQFNGLPPVVTIYGSRFENAAGQSYTPPADELINGTLDVYDEFDNALFSLTIFTDTDIHLRAPGSEEEEEEQPKERIEAELRLMPTVMHRHRRRPVIFAKICLPEDISKDDIDNQTPLVIKTPESEVGVEARYQRIFQLRRREDSQVKIFALFNIAGLLQSAEDDCEELQLQVIGTLKSGQGFYGNDDIRVLSPRKRHWRSRISMIRKHSRR